MLLCFVFFCFKQKAAYEMRISDWISDVCSSDLFLFAPGTSEEQVMEIGLDAGAEDIQTDEEGMIEVICAPNDYPAVKAAFEQASLTPEVQDVVMKALSETELTGDDAVKMQKMLDALEGLDDVQEVYTTAAFDESD